MTDRVYRQETIFVGEDGDIELTIRRNTIARQRRVMAQFDKEMKSAGEALNKIQDEIERAEEANEEPDEKILNSQPDEYDAYVTLVAMCIERSVDSIESVDFNLFTAQRRVTKEFREWIEENIDETTLLHIIDVCAGLDLRPENLIEKIQAQIPQA